MACGCKKKRKITVPGVVSAEVEELAAMPRNIISATLSNPEVEVLVQCLNCVGLLSTAEGRYLPMQTGKWQTATLGDVARWRSQGWFINIKN